MESFRNFRSPEVLRPEHEFRPELAPEEDLCLESLITQVEAKAHGDIDSEADAHLIKNINNAVVEADPDSGTYLLACQQPGCEVNRVIVERASGANGRLKLVLQDDRDFLGCLYRQG